MTDRLSKLPDPILIRILSLLRINIAASTTALSKRWQYIWTHITALRINEPLNKSQLFKILIHCGKQLCWDDFHTIQLRITSYDVSISTLVIDDIISGQNVRVLSLHFDYNDIKYSQLPSSLFELKSLEMLELSSRFDMTLPKKGVNLPCLKKLDIHVRCFQLQLLSDIVSSCPLLEHLSMHVFLRYPKSSIYLWSNSLKRLEVEAVLEFTYREYGIPALRILKGAPMLIDIDIQGKGCVIRISDLH